MINGSKIKKKKNNDNAVNNGINDNGGNEYNEI